jgi:hypothetical protein
MRQEIGLSQPQSRIDGFCLISFSIYPYILTKCIGHCPDSLSLTG